MIDGDVLAAPILELASGMQATEELLTFGIHLVRRTFRGADGTSPYLP